MPPFWKKNALRRKIAAQNSRVKNKRRYQVHGRLAYYYYSHLGIWYCLKLALIARSFLCLTREQVFAKVHRRRKPEFYDLLYHITRCEYDVQAIIIQRAIRAFLRRRREKRRTQMVKAKIIQRWWRKVVKTKTALAKGRKFPNIDDRSKSVQVSVVMTDHESQTEPEADETSEELNPSAVALRTIREGLGYIINSISPHHVHEDIIPIALALQEAATIAATEI